MRRQDLTTLVLYYCGFTKLRNPILRRRGGPLARFVTYHDIPADRAESFYAMLRYLQSHTNVVSMDDYFAGRLSDRKTNVVITFDDGYRSWATIGAPMLRELGLPATFFISSGLLEPLETDGSGAGRDSNAGPVHQLTETDVRELARSGFTVGGHTTNHVNLGAIYDAHELSREIAADKLKLEAITEKEVRYFAYPFGACRNTRLDLVGLLKSAGYLGAVTTMSGVNSQLTNPFLLHRELTGLPMSLRVFAARVNGAYDGVRFLKGRVGLLSG